MSGTFPTTPAPSSLKVTSVQPTLVSTAHSLKRQVRSRGAQRWGFSLAFENRTRAEMAAITAFAIAQRGQYGTFTYYIPSIGSTRGTATAATCSGATASGRTVAVTTNGTLKAGDFVKFAGHNKVYMLTADAASGATNLAIEPALYASVANTEAVTVVNVPMVCALASDAVDFTRDLSAWSMSFDLIEAL